LKNSFLIRCLFSCIQCFTCITVCCVYILLINSPYCHIPIYLSTIAVEALSDTAIRPSVCLMAQLPAYAIGTLAACSL